MKQNILSKLAVGCLIAASMGSCSDDYLDLAPITSVSTNAITSNISAAKSSYIGVIESMYTQYQSYRSGYMLINGEPWVAMYFEQYSQDYISWFWPGRGSLGTYVNNWEGMNQGTYWMPQVAWTYCYTVISYCNGFLEYIDDMVGSESELKQAKYMKAGVLTMRANAYLRLCQVYGPRWEDSNNGDTKTAVLRLEQGTDPLPLSTMAEILDQIYADLDLAIANFEESGVTRDNNNIWEPTINVAKGVYSRAAMLKHDWTKARQMAKEARSGVTLMTGDQYKEGFAIANGEWMWANILNNFVYYWAHGSVYACNGPYPTTWAIIGAGAINYDLWKQIPKGDVRRDLYFCPGQDFYLIKRDNVFWNAKYVDPANLDVNYKNANMVSELQGFGNRLKPNESWPNSYQDDSGELGAGEHIYAPFGAQFKFWGTDGYGTNQFPFMRGAEMYLNEAEAAYECGDEGSAKQILTELNVTRNPNYTCTTSGTALRDEIRMYRRVELWGEGFNLFDFKRWNIPMERRAWVEGDVNSGNVQQAYAIKKEPSDNYGWRFAIPLSEYQYNPLVNMNETYEETRAPRTRDFTPMGQKK